MRRRRKLYAKTVIKAIEGSAGIISVIAKKCEVEWHTIQKYIKTNEAIRQAYEDECSKISDVAESAIIAAIRDKDVNAAKWYLENKARDRGYGKPLPEEKANNITLNFIDSEKEYEERTKPES